MIAYGTSNTLRIVLLSGPVCAGKSALARRLEERHAAKIIKTRELILKQSPRTKPDRVSLQKAGQRLDRKDEGAWVGEALQRTIDAKANGQTPSGLFVVDAVRIRGQIDAIRRAYDPDAHHVHLTAPDDELERRFQARSGESDQELDYGDLKRNRTERQVETLADVADIVVSTDRCSEEAVLVRATALLGLYPRSSDALVDVLIGGQFGSE